MATLTFTNLSPEQAITLAEWFEGEGEQSCQTWFDYNSDEPAPLAEVGPNAKTIDDEGNVTLKCRTVG